MRVCLLYVLGTLERLERMNERTLAFISLGVAALAFVLSLFSSEGPQGPQGIQGLTGPAGNSSVGSSSAWVTGNGTIYNETAKVGIGTSSPSELLTLGDSSTVDPMIEFHGVDNDVSGINFLISNGNVRGYVRMTAAEDLEIKGDNLIFDSQNRNDALYISTTGRVGVNTNNPQDTLHVSGEVRVDDLTTGSNAGTTLCYDVNQVLCICGSCA